MGANMKDKHYIKLGEHHHEVRIKDGRQEIFAMGVWLGTDQFLDCLMEAGRFEDLKTLAEYGHECLKKQGVNIWDFIKGANR